MSKRKREYGIWSDPWLMVGVLALTLIGVVVIYSSTHQIAMDKFGDAYFYLKKHLFSLSLGLFALWAATKIPVEIYRKASAPFLIFIIGILVLIHVPGFGIRAGGALRWMKIAGIRVGQPSELAKLAVVLYLAHSLTKKYDRTHLFKVGFVPHALVLGVVLALLMTQPDFGTSVMILTLSAIMLYVGGVQLRFLLGSAMLSLPAVYLMLIWSPYRWKRITAFLDPFHPDNIQGSAYQLVQSLKAFVGGGLWGAGLGESQQKLGYLPEAHTDFIFAILGEELGLLGVFFTLALFLLVLHRGFRIALRSNDPFRRYMAVGLTSLIGIQALINMGVVMGSLPTKGMPLPFISFARTSLIVILASVGILLQLEAHTLEQIDKNQKRKVKHSQIKHKRKRAKSRKSTTESESIA